VGHEKVERIHESLGLLEEGDLSLEGAKFRETRTNAAFGFVEDASLEAATHCDG
jgi:hypothetical protein